MKKTKNVIIASIAVVTMALSALTFTACESKETAVNGTYTMNLTAEQCAGNLYVAGFMDSVQASQTNTLVLSDGSYTLTKHVTTPKDLPDPAGGDQPFSPNVDVVFTFTGTYTVEEDVVVLDKAVDCEFNANYGVFFELGTGLLNDSGKASAGDMVNCFGTWDDNSLDFFAGEYFNKTFNDVVRVQVDSTNNSYKIVKAASSDDD